MKTKLLILLLLTVCTLGFAQDYLINMNGHDWSRMTSEQKLTFADGFLIAAWSIIYSLNETIGLNDATIKYLSFAGITDVQVIREVDRYYAETGLLDMPIGVVFFERNTRPAKPKQGKPRQEIKLGGKIL